MDTDERTEEERLDDEAAPWAVQGFESKGGSVWTLRATDPQGDEHLIGVDHRPAREIEAALVAGEDVFIERPEAWQVLR